MADFGELERALARPDAELMCKWIDAYAAHLANGDGDWPDADADAFGEIISSGYEDPAKALAYIVLAVSRVDSAPFLAMLACGPLEDLLSNPSDELLDRVVAEAGRSERFRWLLSHPFKVAIASRAWAEIERYRLTGEREEPPADKLPPRN